MTAEKQAVPSGSADHLKLQELRKQSMEPARRGKLLGKGPVKPMSSSEVKLLQTQMKELASGDFSAVPLKVSAIDPETMSTAKFYERPKEKEKFPEGELIKSEPLPELTLEEYHTQVEAPLLNDPEAPFKLSDFGAGNQQRVVQPIEAATAINSSYPKSNEEQTVIAQAEPEPIDQRGSVVKLLSGATKLFGDVFASIGNFTDNVVGFIAEESFEFVWYKLLKRPQRKPLHHQYEENMAHQTGFNRLDIKSVMTAVEKRKNPNPTPVRERKKWNSNGRLRKVTARR